MSAIQQALIKLDTAVAKAENAARNMDITLQGKQRDMFASPALAPSPNHEESYIDGAVVADKLNSTIQKMEKLLESA